MTSNTSITKPIEGKVALVLNERELAINIGTEKGVKEGMKFKVLVENATKIVDPTTDAFLGEVNREKVRVRASEVSEYFSVCRTYRKQYVSGSPLSKRFGNDILVGEPRFVIETLKKKDDSSYWSSPSEEARYVKKGDKVVQLIRDDD